MKADMLKRVVRAIAEGSKKDLEALASKIVDTERRTGHAKLADELSAILRNTRSTKASDGPSGPGRSGPCALWGK